MKKRISKILAMACVFALLVGSFAYFTDHETKSATATAGNIDLVFTDESKADVNKADGQTNTTDAVYTNGIVKADDVMNPGDTYDMGFSLKNTGSKSIDAKVRVTIASDEALGTPAEYALHMGAETLTPTATTANTLVYELDAITLQGTVEKDGVASQDYDMFLEFLKAAKNAFMDNEVTVTLDIQAKQHRNSTIDTDWVEWASYTTAFEKVN